MSSSKKAIGAVQVGGVGLGRPVEAGMFPGRMGVGGTGIHLRG